MEFRDQIGHEISSVSSFVESIAQPCTRVNRSVAFIDSSEEFFEYISTLAKRTQAYLRKLRLESMAGDEFDNNRQQLTTIRESWKELHQLVKPASDADTLHMPLALVRSLARRVHKIEGFQNVDFAIFHTNEFNYLQVRPSQFRVVVNKVALILGADELRNDLGLIGMPGSQSRALFINCLLAHEIGHYGCDRKALVGRIKAEVEAAVNLESKGKLSVPEQNIMVEVVARWAEELFCDLFAVLLVGPCYTFAYVELFDLVNLLTRDLLLCEPKIVERLGFHWQHPAHVFRVQQQTELLRSNGWWDQIKGGESRHIALMNHLLTFDIERYSSGDPPNATAIKALISILPEIRKWVGEIAGKIDPCTHDYALLHAKVHEYLRNGVVPSTLTGLPGHVGSVRPTDVTILNAAFMFYLEEVSELMSAFPGPAATDDIGRRQFWMQRVEDWTAKALGDLQLAKGHD